MRIFVLVACAVAVTALGGAYAYERPPVENPSRVELTPPPLDAAQRASMARDVQTLFIAMPIDHFDPQNPNTFQMRYMVNGQFFRGEGDPIFVMAGGEWAISPTWLMAGNMFEMARENHGYMVYTEHRYYGETIPFSFYDNSTLQYLNIDQALADLAYFIRELKKQPRFRRSEVVLVGGSYAANMVMWFKQRYPHLVKGVVASSGPIQATFDYYQYLEVVHNSFRSEGGQECIDIIKEGIDAVFELARTEEGRRTLETTFQVCFPLDWDSRDAGYFAGFITWVFSGSTQIAVPGSIRDLCHNFLSGAFGETPLQALAGYVLRLREIPPTGCSDLRYSAYVGWFRNNTYSDAKAWTYQTCTEYAYWQTGPYSGTVFDGFRRWLDVDWYTEICKQVFDDRFDVEYVQNAVNRVNAMFGGLAPDVDHTINIHGVIDPWHAIGVHYKHLKDSSPTITIPRASHCFDLQPWQPTDTILMSSAKQTVKRIVRQWLADDDVHSVSL